MLLLLTPQSKIAPSNQLILQQHEEPKVVVSFGLADNLIRKVFHDLGNRMSI